MGRPPAEEHGTTEIPFATGDQTRNPAMASGFGELVDSGVLAYPPGRPFARLVLPDSPDEGTVARPLRISAPEKAAPTFHPGETRRIQHRKEGTALKIAPAPPRAWFPIPPDVPNVGQKLKVGLPLSQSLGPPPQDFPRPISGPNVLGSGFGPK